MELYAIRRQSGWGTAEELAEAAARSRATADEQMPDDVRWIRSYVVQESDGQLGTICIYQASSPEAIRTHAERAELPAHEIVPVADTVIVRPDPAPAAA